VSSFLGVGGRNPKKGGGKTGEWGTALKEGESKSPGNERNGEVQGPEKVTEEGKIPMLSGTTAKKEKGGKTVTWNQRGRSRVKRKTQKKVGSGEGDRTA